MNAPLRLGTRRSTLALAQSGQVAEAVRQACGVDVELVPIITRGDTTPGDLSKFGGKGLFTEELESGLLDGSLDLAVHSLKDLPVRLPDGLTIAARPPRVDPRDALISEVGADLDALAPGSVLLTGSLRRRALILAHRSDLRVEPLRGNVDTRLRKWRESGHAGVILAASGLQRLQETGKLDTTQLPLHPLDPEIVIPAPGQGVLAIEVKEGSRAHELCSLLDDPATARAARTERIVVEAFGADCTLPLAAWARETAGELRLLAALVLPDGTRIARAETSGDDPDTVAAACVDALRAQGADEILRELRPQAPRNSS